MTTSISSVASQISLNTYQGMSVTVASSILGLSEDATVLDGASALSLSSVEDIVEISAAALDAAAAQYTGFEAFTSTSEEETSYSYLASQLFGTSPDSLADDSVLSALLTSMYSDLDLFDTGGTSAAVQALMSGST